MLVSTVWEFKEKMQRDQRYLPRILYNAAVFFHARTFSIEPPLEQDLRVSFLSNHSSSSVFYSTSLVNDKIFNQDIQKTALIVYYAAVDCLLVRDIS